MAFSLKRRLYRERKRLTFVTTLAFLAGVIFYLHAEFPIAGIPFPLITGTIYAVIIGATAAFFCVVMPSIRFMIEAMAISRLMFAVFVFSFPEIGYPILFSPFAAATVVVLGGFVVSRVVHGRITKKKARTLADHFSLSRYTRREPALLNARAWQHSFVRWIDDTSPVPA